MPRQTPKQVRAKAAKPDKKAAKAKRAWKYRVAPAAPSDAKLNAAFARATQP